MSKTNQTNTPPPPPQPPLPPWLPPNLPSTTWQQTDRGAKGSPNTASSTGKGTKTSLNKESRIFRIVSVEGNKSRITIDQSLRNPTSRLSTKSINHANHQDWLRVFKPPNLPLKLQRITIDQRLRNLTSRLSTKSSNHANHQAWPLLSQPHNTPSSLLVTYVSIRESLPSLHQKYSSPVLPGLRSPCLIICPQPAMHQSRSGKKRAIQWPHPQVGQDGAAKPNQGHRSTVSRKHGKIVPRNSGDNPLHPDYWSQI